MAKNSGKKQYKITMKLSTATIWLIVIGLLFIIVANILLNVFSEAFLAEYHATKPALDIFCTIGSTLFSAGIVSVLVEISTIKNLVSDALYNALQGKFPLDAYSNQVLTKINKQIAARRGAVNIEKIDNSIYSVEPKLIESLDGLYYTYYKATYEITPDEERGVFKKYVMLDYEVINEYDKTNQVSHTIRLYNVDDKMTDEQKKAAFNVKSFVINETDLSDEVDNYKTIIPIKEKHSEYQYAIKFKRELQHCRKHRIRLEFEYEVPIYDMSQIFRLTFPCKSMTHDIYVVNENAHLWNIHGAAFVSFYCKENNDHGFHVTQKHDTNLQIAFNNWCIPGAGYVAYLTKNK